MDTPDGPICGTNPDLFYRSFCRRWGGDVSPDSGRVLMRLIEGFACAGSGSREGPTVREE